MSKNCFTCKITKDESDFHKNGKGTLKSSCKDCRSKNRKSHSNGRVGREAETRAHLKQRYRLTPEEKVKMIEIQGGACKICKNEFPVLDVDHCHQTGKIRGLLCRTCNLGLGQFKDSVNNLRRAADYLEKNHAD